MICPEGWCLEQRLGLTEADLEVLYALGSLALSAVGLLLTAALVGVTIWYARSTKRMVDEMRLQRSETFRQTQELVRQNRIHQYERRAAILRGVLRCFGLIFRDGRVGDEVIPCLLEATSEREYLLDPELCSYLDEIYRKAVHAYTNYLQWKDLPQGEERTRLVHEHADLIRWLTEQPVELRQRFRQYLQLED